MNCVLFYGSDVTTGISKYAGPARLATELRLHGFSVICIDIGTIQDPSYLDLYQRIIDKFVSTDTYWVGFSTTFFQKLLGIPIRRITNDQDLFTDNTMDREFMSHIIGMCRTRNNNIKFVVGGGRYLNLHKYDFYHFRGNADHELVEFTKWCKESHYKPKINRLDRVITCKEYDRFVDSKIIWDETDLLEPTTVLPIEISRGCIFRCKFCAFPMNGKTKGEWVKYSDVLLQELTDNYHRFGITEYIFADDTYNDSLDKITELYNRVFSQLPFKIKWTSYLRFDLMYRYRESADVLRKSGLKNVMIGLETNNDHSAKAIGKGLNFQEQIEYLRELKSDSYKDILISSGFIYGLPHDTVQSVQDLHQWLLSDQNPLDNWVATVLGLNPPDLTREKNSFSEIDLNYKKYGYVISEAQAKNGHMEWTLPGNNLTYEFCRSMADATDSGSINMDRYRAGSFIYPRYRSMGIPESDLLSKSFQTIRSQYKPQEIVNAWREKYFTRLLSL